MNPDATLVLVGGPKGNWIAPILGPLKALIYSPFVSQEFVMIMAELGQEDLQVLAELMEEGKMTPVIDRRYPLQEVAEAIRYSEKGRARGEIVITVE